MAKQYHSFSNRAGPALKWGLLAIFPLLVFAYWPNESRKLERQIVRMAAAISHQGSTVSPDWLNGLSSSIRENCDLETTVVSIEGLVNEALTPAQIIEDITHVASTSSNFSVKLEQVTVTLSNESKRAQVHADAVVELAYEGRVDKEKRHVTMTLQGADGNYRLISVAASAPILDQPEPRP